MEHFMVKICSDDKLVQRCLLLIVDLVVSKKMEAEDLEKLPKELKESLLNIFSKRGYVTDENISVFLRNTTKSLELSECLSLTDKSLEKISSVCKNLLKIDLNSLHSPRSLITSKGVCTLARYCRNLQTIFLRRCELVDDTCIEAIAQNCPRLSALNIGNCPLITDKSLIALARHVKFLKSINYSGTNVTDYGVIALFSSSSVAQTIEEIQMSSCEHVTDDSIECILMNSKRIKYLLFHSCPSITEVSRDALADYITSNLDQKVKHLTWTVY